VDFPTSFIFYVYSSKKQGIKMNDQAEPAEKEVKKLSPCDMNIYTHGEVVCVMAGTSEDIEVKCKQLNELYPSFKYDWHRQGGRAVIKRLPVDWKPPSEYRKVSSAEAAEFVNTVLELMHSDDKATVNEQRVAEYLTRALKRVGIDGEERFTTPIYDTLDASQEAALKDPFANAWDHFNKVVPTLKLASIGEWSPYANYRCKYIEMRIDMRTGHCILRDRNRIRITPEELAKQCSDSGKGLGWKE
jgi:hypothetical protein